MAPLFPSPSLFTWTNPEGNIGATLNAIDSSFPFFQQPPPPHESLMRDKRLMQDLDTGLGRFFLFFFSPSLLLLLRTLRTQPDPRWMLPAGPIWAFVLLFLRFSSFPLFLFVPSYEKRNDVNLQEPATVSFSPPSQPVFLLFSSDGKGVLRGRRNDE